MQFVWVIRAIDASYGFIHSNCSQQCERRSDDARWNLHRGSRSALVGLLDQFVPIYTKNYVSGRHHMCNDIHGGQRGNQRDLAIKAYVFPWPMLANSIHLLIIITKCGNFVFYTGVDIIPFICTLIACLIYSIEFGIIIGIAINISFVLYNIARPVIHVYNRKVRCESLITHPAMIITHR